MAVANVALAKKYCPDVEFSPMDAISYPGNRSVVAETMDHPRKYGLC